MNPAFGLFMWFIIGALAGWIGSKIMGTDARQGSLAGIITGIVGAVVGGFVVRSVFGDSSANNAFFASTLLALLGSIAVIGVRKLVSRQTA